MSQWAYLTALAITLACEAPVVLVGYRRFRLPRVVATFLAVNLLTHGLLWTVRPATATTVAIAETLIVIVEAALYARLLGGDWRRAAVVSLVANTLSFGAGLALA